MTKSTKAGGVRIYGTCLLCSNAHKRKREHELASAPRGADGTLVEAVSASDPSPARLLVELLREDRDRWRFDFTGAWAEDVAFVLARIPQRDERELWRVTFESTRSAWQAAWSNAPGPGSHLSRALADEPSSGRVALFDVA